MTAFEVVLLLCGIVCVVVSFIMGDSGKDNASADIITSKLTEEQKSDIRRQVNEIVEEEVQNASEKTEISLDRISNTKILEMNEYAENVLGQINRNHNETVFLYDMLNDKAKEVKTTVKDINTTKRQVERIQAEIAEIDNGMKSVMQTMTVRDDALDVSFLDDAFVPGTPENERNVKKEKQVRTEKNVKADKAAKTEKPNKPDNAVKEKEFRMMTPDIVKEVNTDDADISTTSQQAAQQASKKPRQSSGKASEADGVSSSNASGNVAKERLHRVVTNEEEPESKEKEKKQNPSEEDRMDEAIMKAGGTDAKPAKAKSTAKKSAKKTQAQTAAKQEPSKEVANMNIQFESGSNNNETILKMYKSGKTNKDIAKELNLGVGEVKLVIDLYNSTR